MKQLYTSRIWCCISGRFTGVYIQASFNRLASNLSLWSRQEAERDSLVKLDRTSIVLCFWVSKFLVLSVRISQGVGKLNTDFEKVQ